MILKIVFKNIGQILVLWIMILSGGVADTNLRTDVGRFSQMDLEGWKSKSFKGLTDYELVEGQDSNYLQAESNQSASALYKKIKIDLSETPYLNWSWAIDAALPTLDEHNKSGDDYVARLYVVVKTGIAPWKTYALNYVWSSRAEKNDTWSNAFTSNAKMIAKRGSNDAHDVWLHEKVNVYEDFKTHFGFDLKEIDGVALMTDTDNSGLSASARYGDVYFSSN